MTAARVLDEMEVLSEPFAVCELFGKCELSIGRLAGASLHYVLAGEGEISFEKRSPIPLQPRTLVLIPAFEFHIMRGKGTQNVPLPKCHPAELGLAHHVASSQDGTCSNRLIAICSRIHVTVRGTKGLIDLIREPLIEHSKINDMMTAPIKKLINELSAPRIGSKALIRGSLLECMIELYRTRLEAEDPALTWMSALSDERLWGALQVMMDQPGNKHSVDSLADVAGMSRSSFAKYFLDSYGSGPMDLLRNLRMTKAATLLAETKLPVKRVAELVGFHSRSAFSRAFINSYEESPGKFRAEMLGL
jgi:AraC-like DNA-binding protein